MSKKKKTVTAPLSYDPGKGRPKEFLAYLNWQEMQALQRLNGGNMEFGPRGLPSFPPEDAVGSGQTPGTGNWTGAPGGSSYGGAGGTSGGGSDSGSRAGGSGTPASSSPSASAASAASAAANAASSQPSSDDSARQAAEIKNAAEAARNSSLKEDISKGGIGSINVGPMQTPVSIGGVSVAGTIAGMAQRAYSPYGNVTPTMPGGGGMGQYNARRGSSTMAVGKTSGIDAFNNIATGSIYGTSPRAARAYDSLESDLDRRALTRAMTSGAYTPSITPNAPQGVFGPRLSADKTYYPDAPSGATIGPRQYSAPSLFESEGYTPEFDGIGGPTDRRITDALKSAASNAYSAVSDYFSGTTSGAPYDVGNLPQLEVRTPDVKNAQSMRMVGGLGIASLPGNVWSSSTQTVPGFDSAQRDLEYGGGPKPPQIANIDRMGPFNTAHDLSRERIISVENVPEEISTEAPLSDAQIQITNLEEQYRAQPSIPQIAPGSGYMMKVDGTPVTAEDIQNLPPDVYKEYMDKMRWARRTDEPYPLTTEQKQKAIVAGGIGRAVTSNPLASLVTRGVGLLGQGIEAIPGNFGEDLGQSLSTAASKIRNPGQAVADYERLNPLQKAQMMANAGKTYNYGTGTTFAGGRPERELGGKGNDFETSPYGRYPGYSEASYTASPAAEETGRPYQYYLWDLGVGVPSPGDPDYNEYQKYRKNRGSSVDV